MICNKSVLKQEDQMDFSKRHVTPAFYIILWIFIKADMEWQMQVFLRIERSTFGSVRARFEFVSIGDMIGEFGGTVFTRAKDNFGFGHRIDKMFNERPEHGEDRGWMQKIRMKHAFGIMFLQYIQSVSRRGHGRCHFEFEIFVINE